jgi:hypothetical protein
VPGTILATPLGNAVLLDGTKQAQATGIAKSVQLKENGQYQHTLPKYWAIICVSIAYAGQIAFLLWKWELQLLHLLLQPLQPLHLLLQPGMEEWVQGLCM